MAKKTTTTTTEEVNDEASKPEINYTEDIQGKSMEQVATEKPKEEKPVETKPKEEEAEVKPEISPDEEEIEFDPEQFKKDTAKEVKDEIASFLAGNKEETKEKVDALEEFRAKFEKDTGKEPTWIDVAGFIKEQTKAELAAEQQAAIKEQQDKLTAQQEVEKTYLEGFKKEFDEELEELYKANKLPKIKNPEDPSDYGVIVQEALKQAMIAENTKRVADGGQPIRSVTRIFTSHFKAPERQVAGGDAPIGGSRSAASSANDDEEIDYFRDVKGGFKKMINGVLRR